MARPIVAILSLVLLAAAILFQFFIILSGAIYSSPERSIYFLEADTNGFSSAPNPARWTYWAVCGSDGKYNDNCGAIVPALPFDPANRHNFGSDNGVPEEFLGVKKYYLLSRFAWVFYLLALLFAVFAFLTSGLALCTRLGAWISAFNTFIALFWQSLAATLMTVWTVKARNVFRNNGHDAILGKSAYGFTWAAVALLFLATLTFCAAGGHKRDRHAAATTTTTTRRRRGFGRFGRRRSVRKEYV